MKSRSQAADFPIIVNNLSSVSRMISKIAHTSSRYTLLRGMDMRHILRHHDALIEYRQHVNEWQPQRHCTPIDVRGMLLSNSALDYDQSRSPNQALHNSDHGTSNRWFGKRSLRERSASTYALQCRADSRELVHANADLSKLVPQYRNTTLVGASISSFIASAFSFTGATICRILKPHQFIVQRIA